MTFVCPQGYHAPRAFIAAQCPMEASLSDFWTLIASADCPPVHSCTPPLSVSWRLEACTTTKAPPFTCQLYVCECMLSVCIYVYACGVHACACVYLHVCECDYTAMHIEWGRHVMWAFSLSASLQNTCYQFWPAAEGGTLNVGQRNVTLLKKMMNSDFDQYKITIQMANYLSLDRVVHTVKQVCLHW